MTDRFSIQDYLASLPEEERDAVANTDIAFDLAFLIHRARERRGLTQKEAAELASMHQQAVSRIEQVDTNVQIDTLRKYMAALGYTLEITLRDAESGELVDRAGLMDVDDLVVSG